MVCTKEITNRIGKKDRQILPLFVKRISTIGEQNFSLKNLPSFFQGSIY